jgi:hypothetical protein
VLTIAWSNTRPTRALNLVSWRSSAAKDFTTRTPETFSSTSAVSSAIRCWTSCSAGARGARSAGRRGPRTARQQRHGRQPPVHREHRRRREQDRQRRLHHEDEPVAQEEAHGRQVDGGARHELAGLLTVEEAQLERLQVAVQPAAQVELHAQRHAARHEPAGDGEGQPQDARGGHGDPQRLEVGTVALTHLVDRAAGQPRDRDGRDHGQRRQDTAHRDAAPVGRRKVSRRRKVATEPS